MTTAQEKTIRIVCDSIRLFAFRDISAEVEEIHSDGAAYVRFYSSESTRAVTLAIGTHGAAYDLDGRIKSPENYVNRALFH